MNGLARAEATVPVCASPVDFAMTEAAADPTVIVEEFTLREPSEAVRFLLPAVFKFTVNVPTPLVSVLGAENAACASLLEVSVTVPE